MNRDASPSVLAEQFDRSRAHLRAIAFRMLGSAHEADDAVQEAWLRASRVETSTVANMAGWLTTITSRICLEMLRVRHRRRREEPIDVAEIEPVAPRRNPEDEVALAESVGLALLVVLDRLGPAERVAFVAHDLFGVPFDEIGQIVARSPAAAKKLASRARHRVHGTPALPATALLEHRKVVEAFLAATRARDLDALIALLAPDVVRRADRAALRRGAEGEVRGARRVAEETITNAGPARFARAALVDGAVGAVVAPRGRLLFVILLASRGGRIASIEVIGDAARLRELRLGIIERPPE